MVGDFWLTVQKYFSLLTFSLWVEILKLQLGIFYWNISEEEFDRDLPRAVLAIDNWRIFTIFYKSLKDIFKNIYECFFDNKNDRDLLWAVLAIDNWRICNILQIFSKIFQDTNMKDSEKSSVRVHFNFMDVEDAYFNRRSSTGSEVRELKGEIGKSSAFHWTPHLNRPPSIFVHSSNFKYCKIQRRNS